MIKEEQNPTGPVLTAAESRRRVLHNMCSSLLYNLSVILFGLLLPRLYSPASVRSSTVWTAPSSRSFPV